MNAVFVRPHHLVRARPGSELRLRDLARLVCQPRELEEHLGGMVLARTPAAGQFAVVPLDEILRRLSDACPDANLHPLGSSDVVVEGKLLPGLRQALLGGGAWLLLLVGAATALLNFHADVNMPAAHREIYRLLTGRSAERPLAVELPYAFGVGLGILLFFKRPSTRGPAPGEPSPLDVELAQYERRLADTFRHQRDVDPTGGGPRPGRGGPP